MTDVGGKVGMRGLRCAGRPWLGGHISCSDLLDFATLNPTARATDLGRCKNRSCVCRRACSVPRIREHEKRPTAGRDKNADGHAQFHYYTYKAPLRDVIDLKSRGCRNLKRGTASPSGVSTVDTPDAE